MYRVQAERGEGDYRVTTVGEDFGQGPAGTGEGRPASPGPGRGDDGLRGAASLPPARLGRDAGRAAGPVRSGTDHDRAPDHGRPAGHGADGRLVRGAPVPRFAVAAALGDGGPDDG